MSELGAIGIVGGERSKDALWAVGRGEVNNCYSDSQIVPVNCPVQEDFLGNGQLDPLETL